jgi:hypothetical protein
MKASQLVRAKKEVLKVDETLIQKWRKELLLLLKNVDPLLKLNEKCCDHERRWHADETERAEMDKLKVTRDERYKEFRQVTTRLQEQFERFLQSLIVQGIEHESLRLDPDSTERANKYYWSKRLRKALWPISSAMFDIHNPFGTKGNKVRLQQWADKMKRDMRFGWKELGEFLEWYKQFRASQQGNPADVEVPTSKSEVMALDGFQTKLVGYDDEDPDDRKHFQIFREGLRIYKEKAQAYPPLLQKKLPLVLSFAHAHEGNMAMKYQYKYIVVNMPWMSKPATVAQNLAHEMGHHMWKSLPQDAQTFWAQSVLDNWGPLDLTKLLEMWPADAKFVSQVASRVRDSDPELSLQLDIIAFPEGSKREISTKEDVEQAIQEGTKVIVPKNPISRYATKNSEEAFCEALSNLVAYGPRTVHPLVRNWLRIVLPDLRAGSMKQAYQAVPKPYTQPESRSGGTRVSDYLRRGMSTGSTSEISQLMKTLSSFEEQNPYPTTIEDYLPKDTSMATDVEALEMIPAPLTKVVVDYARKQLHFNNPLISDVEKTKDNKWLVTVMTRQHEKAGLIVDPRNQKVVGVN